ncbi:MULTISPECIES: DUF1189 family protein [unclassified Clostridium]|uniref:DUF1189 family protein n=1 Tax=unclassified Clostridium TaxID=2614128 RepID=UPI0002978949|nr:MULTISPECIES: DUF1189 family protein [unclassified Clostridium]EKQ52429.1 MAG: hypothetical protein A370_04146 [Clostridium sp. Maddingley MBC34-26]
MNYKTNFFKKVITSIYDIKVFSKYAKEGLLRSIFYAILLMIILSGIKGIANVYKIDNFELMTFIYNTTSNFGVGLSNLLFNCLIVTVVASLFTIFMQMVVRYKALFSLTLYAATLPLIIQSILEIVKPDINFDTMFIIGTLTYVILILKYLKDEIIKNLN